MIIGILGLGNMGTAMANIIASNGYEVIGWEYNRDVVEQINTEHQNTRYLPGIAVNGKITATENIPEVLERCEVLFIALPSVFITKTLAGVKDKVRKSTIIVDLAKGIDGKTYLTSFQTISGLFPDNPRVMLSGPSIANEFAKCTPTMVVIAGKDRAHLSAVGRILDNKCFRVRFSDDETGVELGGILKNIYAIGLGLFDGLKVESINFRSVYITLALEEMSRLGTRIGGRKETFYYIAGLGDLIATSLSRHSHNRHLGELLAGGMGINEIEKTMGVLPEGYNTLKIILYIAEKNHVSMPLAKALWDVLSGKLTTEKFVYSFITDFIE